MAQDLVSEFLYWHPLGMGFPDETILIGVEFEAGGRHEDWGYVVKKAVFDEASGKYDLQIYAEGGNLEKAIANARKRYEEEANERGLRDSFASVEVLGESDEGTETAGEPGAETIGGGTRLKGGG